MKKKRLLIVGIFVVALLVLFVPIPDSHKDKLDGGYYSYNQEEYIDAAEVTVNVTKLNSILLPEKWVGEIVIWSSGFRYSFKFEDCAVFPIPENPGKYYFSGMILGNPGKTFLSVSGFFSENFEYFLCDIDKRYKIVVPADGDLQFGLIET